MQLVSQTKTRSIFSTLVGGLLVGALSACGGGGGETNNINQPDLSNTHLNKYAGTYSPDECSQDEILHMRSTSYDISLSEKPNTLNIVETRSFYELTPPTYFSCEKKVGSSTVYGELIYLGTLPAVEFANSTRSSLPADKFQWTVTKVVNEGTYSHVSDEVSDFRDVNVLFAQEDNVLYRSSSSSPFDSDGFHTQLSQGFFLIKRVQNSSKFELNNYIGSYSNYECSVSKLSEIPNDSVRVMRNTAYSASKKPNTLNVVDTYVYYAPILGMRCSGQPIGSSSAYGEMVYLGTLPSVAFSDPTVPFLNADKFQITYTSVVNQGTYGIEHDEISEFIAQDKILLALAGNAIYSADYNFPLDAQGFPTKLDRYSVVIR